MVQAHIQEHRHYLAEPFNNVKLVPCKPSNHRMAPNPSEELTHLAAPEVDPGLSSVNPLSIAPATMPTHQLQTPTT
jgi:hypothetical protein